MLVTVGYHRLLRMLAEQPTWKVAVCVLLSRSHQRRAKRLYSSTNHTLLPESR